MMSSYDPTPSYCNIHPTSGQNNYQILGSAKSSSPEIKSRRHGRDAKDFWPSFPPSSFPSRVIVFSLRSKASMKSSNSKNIYDRIGSSPSSLTFLLLMAPIFDRDHRYHSFLSKPRLRVVIIIACTFFFLLSSSLLDLNSKGILINVEKKQEGHDGPHKNAINSMNPFIVQHNDKTSANTTSLAVLEARGRDQSNDLKRADQQPMLLREGATSTTNNGSNTFLHKQETADGRTQVQGVMFESTNQSHHNDAALIPHPETANQPINTTNTTEDQVLLRNMVDMEAKGICTAQGWPSGNFQRQYVLPEAPEQIVRGGGTYSNGTKLPVTEASDYAICKFVVGPSAWHFPHTMQALYMCWAWWATNPTKIPVFAIPWEFRPQIAKSPFNSGIMPIIKSIGVRFAHYSPDNVSAVPLHERPSQIERVGNLTDQDIARLYVKPYHSGYAFSSYEDADKLRKGVVHKLFPNRTESECERVPVPRIGILNRKGSRTVANADFISSELGRRFGTNVAITYFEGGKTFQEQVDFFSSTDVLISPHGAQLTGALFLPKCGGAMEIFPRGYYLGNLFPNLVAGTGKHYGYIYASIGDMMNETAAIYSSREGRDSARAGKLCPPVSKVVDGVEQLVKEWRECCRNEVRLG